ncbi:hypothetical protein QR685DRAFT_595411 [Neurospora intermedia]|uniref:Uncharacterized protein n=1 Tax=Neurospora intermedia TaxID=5142 RepID=A0ABR3DPA6_NEUIN
MLRVGVVDRSQKTLVFEDIMPLALPSDDLRVSNFIAEPTRLQQAEASQSLALPIYCVAQCPMLWNRSRKMQVEDLDLQSCRPAGDEMLFRYPKIETDESTGMRFEQDAEMGRSWKCKSRWKESTNEVTIRKVVVP